MLTQVPKECHLKLAIASRYFLYENNELNDLGQPNYEELFNGPSKVAKQAEATMATTEMHDEILEYIKKHQYSINSSRLKDGKKPFRSFLDIRFGIMIKRFDVEIEVLRNWLQTKEERDRERAVIYAWVKDPNGVTGEYTNGGTYVEYNPSCDESGHWREVSLQNVLHLIRQMPAQNEPPPDEPEPDLSEWV